MLRLLTDLGPLHAHIMIDSVKFGLSYNFLKINGKALEYSKTAEGFVDFFCFFSSTSSLKIQLGTPLPFISVCVHCNPLLVWM